MAQSVPYWIPSQGLVAYYPLDSNAKDMSGNQLNGAINGTAIFDTARVGASGKSMKFNGINTWIDILDDPQLRFRNGTIIYWIKTTASSKQTIIVKSDVSTSNSVMYGSTINDPTNGQVIFGVKYNSNCLASQGWSFLNNNLNINNGLWHMIAFVFRSDSLIMYDNGIKKASSVSMAAGIDSCSGANVRIGRNWANDNRFFQGSLDDVFLYNRPLTEQEINAVYLNCPSTSLIANNPSNQTAIDGSLASFSVKSKDAYSSYRWQFNNGIGFFDLTNQGAFSGVDKDTLKIQSSFSLNNVEFRCIISSRNNCKVDTSVSAILSVIQGVKVKEIDEIDFTYGPNPACNEIVLDINSPLIDSHNKVGQNAQLFDLFGRVVQTWQITSGYNLLYLDDIKSGYYYLRINLLNGQCKSVPIIINN
jgi:hypothetical protein